MIKKIFGFLTQKGWEGVEEVYWFVAMGVLIGMILLYQLLIYRKDYMPKKLTVVQSHLTKIIITLAILVLLFII